jgi:hypothetical protein
MNAASNIWKIAVSAIRGSDEQEAQSVVLLGYHPNHDLHPQTKRTIFRT